MQVAVFDDFDSIMYTVELDEDKAHLLIMREWIKNRMLFPRRGEPIHVNSIHYVNMIEATKEMA